MCNFPIIRIFRIRPIETPVDLVGHVFKENLVINILSLYVFSVHYMGKLEKEKREIKLSKDNN